MKMSFIYGSLQNVFLSNPKVFQSFYYAFRQLEFNLDYKNIIAYRSNIDGKKAVIHVNTDYINKKFKHTYYVEVTYSKLNVTDIPVKSFFNYMYNLVLCLGDIVKKKFKQDMFFLGTIVYGGNGYAVCASDLEVNWSSLVKDLEETMKANNERRFLVAGEYLNDNMNYYSNILLPKEITNVSGIFPSPFIVLLKKDKVGIYFNLQRNCTYFLTKEIYKFVPGIDYNNYEYYILFENNLYPYMRCLDIMKKKGKYADSHLIIEMNDENIKLINQYQQKAKRKIIKYSKLVNFKDNVEFNEIVESGTWLTQKFLNKDSKVLTHVDKKYADIMFKNTFYVKVEYSKIHTDEMPNQDFFNSLEKIQDKISNLLKEKYGNEIAYLGTATYGGSSYIAYASNLEIDWINLIKSNLEANFTPVQYLNDNMRYYNEIMYPTNIRK